MEAQIIAALKQVEAGRTVDDIARECGVSLGHDLREEGQVRRPREGLEAFRAIAIRPSYFSPSAFEAVW
jgi:hypothetical protein